MCERDDMDDDNLFNEKQSIRESGKSLKKYGSTCNHVGNTEILITHTIEKDETLQGIALKYGCTTEQIRRANRLFATDSLFLRQSLMIPVEKGSPFYPKDDRPRSLPARAASIAGFINLQKPNTSVSLNTLSPEEENKKNIDEFLGKIDSTIAESKKYVIQSQKSNNFTKDGSLTNNRRPSSSISEYNNPSSRYQGTIISNNNHHEAITSHVVVMTQGRRVQSSLQKLEKQQDEFFEL